MENMEYLLAFHTTIVGPYHSMITKHSIGDQIFFNRSIIFSSLFITNQQKIKSFPFIILA